MFDPAKETGDSWHEDIRSDVISEVLISLFPMKLNHYNYSCRLMVAPSTFMWINIAKTVSYMSKLTQETALC